MKNQLNNKIKKMIALISAFALIVSGITVSSSQDIQAASNKAPTLSGYFSGTENVLLASQKPYIAKGTESYTTLSFDFDWTDVADIKKSQLEDDALVILGMHLKDTNKYGYGIKNIVLYV